MESHRHFDAVTSGDRVIRVFVYREGSSHFNQQPYYAEVEDLNIVDVSEHTPPHAGRSEVPMTRRELREARLAVPVPRMSRRERRLLEQAEQAENAAQAEDAAQAEPNASPVAMTELPGPPSATTEGSGFRFDVGMIPLSPFAETSAARRASMARTISEPSAREDREWANESAVPGVRHVVRRSLFVAISAASVVGLSLTATLPALAPMDVEGGTQAAAIQRLSLGSSADTVLSIDFVEGIDGAEVLAEAAVLSADTYVNNPKGLVQYPFSRGVPLTDGFGYRTAPVAQFHDAQDFAAGDGAAIRSIAEGVVTESGETTDGCGTGVKIAHKVDGLDVTSRYCHMQFGSERVAVGDQVRVGQMIGRVGSTGMSFGAHLHLALQVKGEAVDPMPFLAKYNAISS